MPLCARTVALLILLLLLPSGVQSSIIASSTLTNCVQTSAADANGTNETLIPNVPSCKSQIVVSLVVPTGQGLAGQTIEATLVSVSSGDNTTAVLETPIYITVTKTPVFAVYPLTYLRNVNAQPTELLLTSASCQDGAYQNGVTCGWYSDAKGAHILNSQGFCCPCSAQESWQQTVLGGAIATTRGNLNCNLFAQGLFVAGIPATASCLRFDPQWYSGYGVGAANIEFTLSVAISSSPAGAPASAAARQVATVTPQQLTAVSGDGRVAAELLGDLAGYAELPVLSGKVLFMPFYANGSVSDPATWLLVDNTQAGRYTQAQLAACLPAHHALLPLLWLAGAQRLTFSSPHLPVLAQVSIDGTQCNMIGTSFTAFNTQPNACGQPQGSCLKNQIGDLVAADRARTAAGQTPRNLLSAWGVGSIRDPLAGSSQMGLRRLALPVVALRSSLVALTINADSVRFITNRSPGFIISSSLVDFNDKPAAAFVALSGNGRVQVAFANNGTLAAAYYLNVVNCSAGVQVFQSPGAVTVAAGAVHVATYLAAVEDSAAARRTCTVALLDALSAPLDSRTLSFYTNATAFDAAPLLLGNASGPGAGAQPGMQKSCSEACPGVADVGCFVLHRCWGAFSKMFGSLMGAGLLAFVLWKLGAFSAAWGCLRAALCSGGGGSGGGGGGRADDSRGAWRRGESRRRADGQGHGWARRRQYEEEGGDEGGDDSRKLAPPRQQRVAVARGAALLEQQADAAAEDIAALAAPVTATAAASASSPCGLNAATVRELRARGSVQVFLHVPRDFPGLAPPGPSACLAGLLRWRPGEGGGGDVLAFSPEPPQQHACFDQRAGAYAELRPPRPLDASAFAAGPLRSLSWESARRLLSSQPGRGEVVLNIPAGATTELNNRA